jgi:hypothetical protein
MSEVWTPTDADRGWLSNLVRSLNNGGVWVVPATGQIFMKRDDSLIWTNEDLGDDSNIFQRTKIIGDEIGIEVYRESEL